VRTARRHQHDTPPAPRYALDALLDDESHLEWALTCFSPLIRHGVRWRRPVSPHLADAHRALTRSLAGVRRMRQAVEAELYL
jgi:hypothetical protein